MTRRLLPGLLAVGLAAAPALADPSVTAVPVIDIAPEGAGLGITGHVRGLGDGQVTATLEIAKSDGAGTVRTRQGREIAVSAGSDDVVATTRLSADGSVSLTVTLTLQSDGTEIGSASTVIGAPAD